MTAILRVLNMDVYTSKKDSILADLVLGGRVVEEATKPFLRKGLIYLEGLISTCLPIVFFALVLST